MLNVGQRIRFMRKGLVHHGEIVEVQPNLPYSEVLYVVRTDEHQNKCVLVLPKAIEAPRADIVS